jgi:hypothetical protein
MGLLLERSSAWFITVTNIEGLMVFRVPTQKACYCH